LKKREKVGSKFKRKLEEDKSAGEGDDVGSDVDDDALAGAVTPDIGCVKKRKRSHEIVKSANAITSSLSSSLLEKEEETRFATRSLFLRLFCLKVYQWNCRALL
jgi:hypothetical protein